MKENMENLNATLYSRQIKTFGVEAMKKLSKLKIISVPNISGKWKGTIDNHEFPKVNVDVEIKQSWTKISIKLQSKNAKS